MQPGVYTNLTNQEYHAHKESISRSALMDFDKSPRTYWANHIYDGRPKKDITPQMKLGSAFHTIILEPNLLDKNYIVKPEPVFLKDVGREAYEKYKGILSYLEKSELIILSMNEMENIAYMKAVLEENPKAMELIRESRIENSFFWKDEHSGLLLKCRPDILHDNIIVDLKTTSDASPRAYQRQMVDGGYHIQGAMIQDAVEAIEGRRIETVINIVIETKYPYNMGIYIIDEYALEAGHMKYKQLCLDMKNALENGIFEDYGVRTISLPKWAI